jgi:hypothetical protein
VNEAKFKRIPQAEQKISMNQIRIFRDYLVKPEIVNRKVPHDKAAAKNKFGNFNDELRGNNNYKEVE